MNTSKEGGQPGGRDKGLARRPARPRGPARAEPSPAPGSLAFWRQLDLEMKLARSPRKIRRWVRETGAHYVPGHGWYVRVPARPSGIAAMASFLAALPPGVELPIPWSGGEVPIEPPLDWPVSSDLRAAWAAERLAEIMDAYEKLPGPVKDPTEDTMVAVVLGALAAAFHRH